MFLEKRGKTGSEAQKKEGGRVRKGSGEGSFSTSRGDCRGFPGWVLVHSRGMPRANDVER